MAKPAYSTDLGQMYEGDSLEVLSDIESDSVDLILTSPPFALTRAKSYGNEPEGEYVEWFMPFAKEFKRVIKDSGSIVIDLGGAWQPGQPTKSIYQYRLLVALVDTLGLHLAQEFYWFNRSKLPGPAQWVNINRVRVKDAVHNIWWLSKTVDPKADNRRILKPYGKDMKKLLERGTYNSGRRASEHHVSAEAWAQDQGGAIPPNVIEVDDAGDPILNLREPDNMLDYSNTDSKEPYHQFCIRNDLPRHPARFPKRVVDIMIRFLTDEGDLVVDPFGGSNVTGELAEDLKRRWTSIELDPEFIAGSLGRFARDAVTIHDPWLDQILMEDDYSDHVLEYPARRDPQQATLDLAAEGTSVEARPRRLCSLCGGAGHNRRSCAR